MTKTHILVANASHAFLYSASSRAKLFNGHSKLELVATFSNPDSRKKNGDLIAGRSGNYHQSKGGYGTFVESSEPRRAKAREFAKDIAQTLKRAYSQHDFKDLIIVAAPAFHGMLNKSMKKMAVNGAVSVDIEKDYTGYRPRELAAKLQAYL